MATLSSAVTVIAIVHSRTSQQKLLRVKFVLKVLNDHETKD